nr:MAG TPA: hypothetical protein [Caudoviricetes sp.]
MRRRLRLGLFRLPYAGRGPTLRRPASSKLPSRRWLPSVG